MSYYRNPFLVIGLLAVLVGVVLLFVPPPGDPSREPGFAAFWWLAAPMIVIGGILMGIGVRKYRMAKQRPEG